MTDTIYEVELKEVDKRIKGKKILSNVNMMIKKGEVVGISGENGSGKTVLLKIVTGLMIPTSGEVIVEGRKIGKETDFPPNAGIIIETPGFMEYKDGFSNLLFWPHLEIKLV